MSTKSVNQLIEEIGAILSRAEPTCVKQLAPVMTAEPRPGQIYACLELFHMQSYELIYNAFFIEAGKLRTEYACAPGFDGTQSFLPELAGYFQTTLGQLDLTEAEGKDFTTRHEQQFVAWFKRVWTAAGGERARVPVYFCFEKEYRVQDVRTGNVMEELEAAQALGHDVSGHHF